jgi:hypothetical protein
LQCFIESCCQQSKFETDFIESDVFQSVYQDFCIVNHMQKVNISEGELKSQFAIQITYKPQQWILRDDSQIKSKTDKGDQAVGKESNFAVTGFVKLVEGVKSLAKLLKNLFFYRLWGAVPPPDEDKIIYFIDRQNL